MKNLYGRYINIDLDLDLGYCSATQSKSSTHVTQNIYNILQIHQLDILGRLEGSHLVLSLECTRGHVTDIIQSD